MSERGPRRGVNWDWMRRQVGGLLIVTYVAAIGGTLNGLVMPRMRVLSVGLLIALGVMWLARRRPRSDPTILLLPMLGLCAAAGIATIFSPDPRHSSLQLGYWGAATIGYWAAMEQTADGEARLRLTRNIQLAIAGIALFAVREIVTWDWPGELPRVSSITGSPNIYGGIVLIGVWLAAGEIVRAQGAKSRVSSLVWLAFLAVMLIMSGSRAAWLGAVVGGIAFVPLVIGAKGGLPLAAWWRWIDARPFRARVGLGLAALVVPAGLWLVITGISAQAAHYTHAPLSDRLAIWGAALAGFAGRPLTGVGPFRFAYALMRHVSVPPEQPHPHAHNLVLQIMAEDGLIGLAGLVWLGLALLGALRSAWIGGDAEERLGVATAAGLAAALLAHNMLDFVLVPSVALTGLWALGATLPPTVSQPRLTGEVLRRWVAPILLILTVGLLIWPLPGAIAAQAGTQAAQVGDWSAAAAAFEQAHRLDPALVVYQFDAAYAYGQAAIVGDDPSALGRATILYRTALAREPEYSLHWANLAVLEMHAGRLDEAREHMERASTLAPDDRAFAQLADALERGQVPSEPGPHPGGLGIGPRYGLYLFHVATPNFQLLPLPSPGEERS